MRYRWEKDRDHEDDASQKPAISLIRAHGTPNQLQDTGLTHSQITEQNNREIEEELNLRSTLLLLESEKFIHQSLKIEDSDKAKCAVWREIIVKLRDGLAVDR